MAKILVVEDEALLARKVKDWLVHEKYIVELVANGEDALGLLETYEYDAVVLDWMLPGLSGLEVLKRFRAGGGTTPIIMLTGLAEIEEKEIGLDTGADDYLTKPFAPKELSARIRALLRRPREFTGNQLIAGNLVFEVEANRVLKDGEEIQLLPLERALLEFFMRHPNQVFNQEAILDRVWKSDTFSSTDVVRTYVKTLRRKIDTQGQESKIRTVFGVGYKFEP
jgi:two-component system OmpR family response regulator